MVDVVVSVAGWVIVVVLPGLAVLVVWRARIDRRMARCWELEAPYTADTHLEVLGGWDGGRFCCRRPASRRGWRLARDAEGTPLTDATGLPLWDGVGVDPGARPRLGSVHRTLRFPVNVPVDVGGSGVVE